MEKQNYEKNYEKKTNGCTANTKTQEVMEIHYMTVFRFNVGGQLQTWTMELLYELLRPTHEKGALWDGGVVSHYL